MFIRYVLVNLRVFHSLATPWCRSFRIEATAELNVMPVFCCTFSLQAKVLGVLAMIDDGELDWKVITVRTEDPLASVLNDVPDIEKHLPGTISGNAYSILFVFVFCVLFNSSSKLLMLLLISNNPCCFYPIAHTNSLIQQFGNLFSHSLF